MRRIFKIFLLTTLPATAQAESFVAKYDATWNGFKVGEMKVVSEEKGNKYTYKAILDSAGLLKKFTKYRSENIANGKLAKDKIVPTKYFTQWWRKKEHQQIVVAYKNNGKLPVEKANPPENRGKRPIVDPKDKSNTFDTVSAAFHARKQIKQLVESGASFPAKIVIPVFDARRRFDVELTINGYKTKEYAGKEQNLLEIVFYRTPVSGFNEKELKRMEQQDPTVTFYLDENYIPLTGTGNAPFGSANFELAELCQGTEKSCFNAQVASK